MEIYAVFEDAAITIYEAMIDGNIIKGKVSDNDMSDITLSILGKEFLMCGDGCEENIPHTVQRLYVENPVERFIDLAEERVCDENDFKNKKLSKKQIEYRSNNPKGPWYGINTSESTQYRNIEITLWGEITRFELLDFD